MLQMIGPVRGLESTDASIHRRFSRFGDACDGDARWMAPQLSGAEEPGPFQILPSHCQFAIVPCVAGDSIDDRIPILRGFEERLQLFCCTLRLRDEALDYESLGYRPSAAEGPAVASSCEAPLGGP